MIWNKLANKAVNDILSLSDEELIKIMDEKIEDGIFNMLSMLSNSSLRRVVKDSKSYIECVKFLTPDCNIVRPVNDNEIIMKCENKVYELKEIGEYHLVEEDSAMGQYFIMLSEKSEE